MAEQHQPPDTASRPQREPGAPLRVVLADDQTLVRAGFRVLIERADDLEVVGEAADGAAAVELVRAERPDVVLMDIRMPVLDGLEATRQILSERDPGGPPGGDERSTGVRVVVLTTFDHDEYVFEALRAGASGFLRKDIDASDLRQAIRVAAGGDALLSPSVTRQLIAAFVTRPPRPAGAADRLAALTEREREVMALVGEGLSNREIAERLFMSPATAKTHVSRAMVKLGARDRAQLVVLAFQTGLVQQ